MNYSLFDQLFRYGTHPYKIGEGGKILPNNRKFISYIFRQYSSADKAPKTDDD